MIIPEREDLKTEFKSDLKILPDHDLIDEVVAITNTEGGEIYLGIEDNGKITGVNKVHKDAIGLKALIMNRTVPSVLVKTEMIIKGDNSVIKIEVPKSKVTVASSQGKILKRRLKIDGTPENVPLYPFELNTRLSDLNYLDYSARIISDSTLDDLNPTERDRLRRLIRLNNGESNLLGLDNIQLDKALGLIKEDNGVLRPTVAGILLLGKEEKLKEYLPTAQTRFQILKGSQVKTNEEFSKPLLETFEILLNYFNSIKSEDEILVGMSRVSLPNFSEQAFREAVVNAFSHRDYTVLQPIRIALENNQLVISSPGSFPNDVNLNNLLTIEPQSRNPGLADALKRIGLAEKTGRGIDKIYEASLRSGKLLPDYSESNSQYVKLIISDSESDLELVKLINQTEYEQKLKFSIVELLILNFLKVKKISSYKDLVKSLKLSDIRILNALDHLEASGVIKSSGTNSSKRYELNNKFYKTNIISNSEKVDILLPTETLLQFIKDNNNHVTRKEISDYFGLSKDSIYRRLKSLINSGKIEMHKQGRSSWYSLPED